MAEAFFELTKAAIFILILLHILIAGLIISMNYEFANEKEQEKFMGEVVSVVGLLLVAGFFAHQIILPTGNAAQRFIVYFFISFLVGVVYLIIKDSSMDWRGKQRWQSIFFLNYVVMGVLSFALPAIDEFSLLFDILLILILEYLVVMLAVTSSFLDSAWRNIVEVVFLLWALWGFTMIGIAIILFLPSSDYAGSAITYLSAGLLSGIFCGVMQPTKDGETIQRWEKVLYGTCGLMGFLALIVPWRFELPFTSHLLVIVGIGLFIAVSIILGEGITMLLRRQRPITVRSRKMALIKLESDLKTLQKKSEAIEIQIGKLQQESHSEEVPHRGFLHSIPIWFPAGIGTAAAVLTIFTYLSQFSPFFGDRIVLGLFAAVFGITIAWLAKRRGE